MYCFVYGPVDGKVLVRTTPDWEAMGQPGGFNLTPEIKAEVDEKGVYIYENEFSMMICKEGEWEN
jgi:hypothetical protein